MSPPSLLRQTTSRFVLDQCSHRSTTPQGDYLLFQKVFAELESCFFPAALPHDVWDDSLPPLDGFLSGDSSEDLTTCFDLNLQAVSSMMSSPFLDMRAEALSIILSLATEASFLLSLSQVTILDPLSSPNYLSCVQTLTKMIISPTTPQTINTVSLALGCLAHLSLHPPTAVSQFLTSLPLSDPPGQLYLSQQREWIHSLQHLAPHPLCQSQCQALRSNLSLE
jgi:hypothetical protein